ncbi:MAG: zinc ribbon domain-containing protein [Bacteroidaceae bacterium]
MAKEKTKNPAEINVEDKLKNLYALQTTLTQIDKVKTLRGELPREVQDLEDEIEGLTTRIEKIGNEINTIRRDISAMNENIEINNTNIARYKAQMDSVRNNREYDNLTKQIEYAELDNQLNEKRISEAKALMEGKTQEMSDCNALVSDRRTDLDIKKSELDEIVADTRAEEDRLREAAKNLECTIEPRLLSAFKRIRHNSRNGLGIVSVDRDACGGCYNKIPPQRQLDIRMRKKIIVCEYCGRIIIDPELAGIQMSAREEEKPKKRKSVSRKKAEE